MNQNKKIDVPPQTPADSKPPIPTPKSDSQPDAIPASKPAIAEPRQTPAILRVFPLLILAGAFSYWSFVARIPVKVTGSSIILVPRSKVEFQARSSGRVMEINVQTGDRVQRGQVLAVIENEEIQEKLLTQRQELAEYEAENVAITEVERERTRLKRETIQRQRETIPIQIEANQRQIESNEKERVAVRRQRATYNQRIEQIDEIDQLISERYEAYQKLVDEGAVAPLDTSVIQSEDVLQKNLNEKTSLLAKLEDLDAKNDQLISQNESLRAQNQNLQAQLANLDTEDEQQTLSDLEADIKRQNTIDNLRRTIANTEVQLQTNRQVLSAHTGEIIELSINVGEYVNAGTLIGKIQVDSGSEEVGLAFFTPENADRIRVGMDVEVIPNLLTERRFGGTRERFGGIVGTITDISKETVTPEEVASIVGSEQLAQTLMENPVPYSAPDPGEATNLPVVQVQIQLQRDPNSPTGYQWTRDDSPNVAIPEGAIGDAKVTLEERSPVSYVVPILRWITGIYGDG